jgi:hydrogenase maturation factor
MEKPQLSLDGRVYPRILQETVPQGVAQVPVIVRDTERYVDFHTQLIAGTVGMSVIHEDESATTVQPRSGWWMLCTGQEKYL